MERVTYKITETNGKFILTDSTDSIATCWSREQAVREMEHWKLEHKYRSKSYAGSAIERAKIALEFIKFGDTDSRIFDNCFEMGDGKLVDAHLTILKHKAGLSIGS